MSPEDAVEELLSLCKRCQATMQINIRALEDLSRPVLSGDGITLPEHCVRLGYHLDHAVYEVANHAFSIIQELDELRSKLLPEQREALDQLSNEQTRLQEQWENFMDAMDHVWSQNRPLQ